MKTYTIYSDLHKYGTHPIDIKLEYGPNVVFLGDEWDLTNVLYKDADKAYLEYMSHRSKCIETNTIIVRCNHSGQAGKGLPIRHVDNGVLFIHGDEVKWDTNTIKKWHNKKIGISKWKRLLISWKNKFFNEQNLKFSTSELDKIARLAKAFECHSIVFGHLHPKGLYGTYHNGVAIRVVPRGKTVLEL